MNIYEFYKAHRTTAAAAAAVNQGYNPDHNPELEKTIASPLYQDRGPKVDLKKHPKVNLRKTPANGQRCSCDPDGDGELEKTLRVLGR